MSDDKLMLVGEISGCKGCYFFVDGCCDANPEVGYECIDDKVIWVVDDIKQSEPVIEVTTIPEEVVRSEVDFEHFGGYIGL